MITIILTCFITSNHKSRYPYVYLLCILVTLDRTSIQVFLHFIRYTLILQVRKGHSKIYQQDVIDVLDKQLLEGMGVLLTEEEQQKCEESVSLLPLFSGGSY